MATSTVPRARHPVEADVYDLIESDHRRLRGLFDEFRRRHERGSDPRDLADVADRLCVELGAHLQAEEEVLYPALRALLEEEGYLLAEAEVEHDTAWALIARIEDGEPDDRLFPAWVTVLGEYVEHHACEEEEALFPAARDAGLDAAAVGAAFGARRHALLAAAAADAEEDADEDADEDEEEGGHDANRR